MGDPNSPFGIFLRDQAKAAMNKSYNEFRRKYHTEFKNAHGDVDTALMKSIGTLSDSAMYAIFNNPAKMEHVITNLIAVAIYAISKEAPNG